MNTNSIIKKTMYKQTKLYLVALFIMSTLAIVFCSLLFNKSTDEETKQPFSKIKTNEKSIKG